MKSFKIRLTALICSAVTALSLAGCGNNINSSPVKKDQSSSSVTSSVTDKDASKASKDSSKSDKDSSKGDKDSSKDDKDSSKSDKDTSSKADTDSSSKADTDSSSHKDDPNKPEPSYKASLLCVGDNLIHDNIYLEAEKKSGQKGKYDFSFAYEHIKDYLKGFDVSIINQETVVTDTMPAKTFPTFATPKEMAAQVKALGFNAVSMCNNHVLDAGESGLQRSLQIWDEVGMLHYGAYADQADFDNIKTMEVNGIKFAFVGYMEHTNGLKLPEGSKAVVCTLSNEAKVKAQIQKADKIADVVVVSCHYGTEISNELNAQQKTLTPKLVEWGADLIIGTQAHALSTCGYIDKKDGTKAFVFYGLGNFLNTMYAKNSLIGLMGELNVVKDKDTGKISFENVKCIPVISHFEGETYRGEWRNCQIYPYAKYTDALFAKNYCIRDGFCRSCVDSILKKYVPKQFLSIE